MIRILPTFKGYTVDMRLREFRKAVWDQELEFIPFASKKGARLLDQFLKTKAGRREFEYYSSQR